MIKELYDAVEDDPYPFSRRRIRTLREMRARVEHPIEAIKRVFSFIKVRYRGLVAWP
jgi:hypothetical protein